MFVNLFLSQPTCRPAQTVTTVLFEMFDRVQQGRPTIIKRPILEDLKGYLASEIPPSFVSVTMGITFDPGGVRRSSGGSLVPGCSSSVGG